jgi:hypothetical protein
MSKSSGGLGIGSVIAVVLSYMKWHSILWAVLHGIFGWLYVIYYVIRYWGEQ